ncbi:MAG: hypothetical protein AAGE52_05420 [Myxococcota bacterium]
MRELLQQLGARLAPPREVDARMPPALRRFQAITRGAELPQLRVRFLSPGEASIEEGLCLLATSATMHWSIVTEGALAGWIADGSQLVFRSLDDLLSAMLWAQQGQTDVEGEIRVSAKDETCILRTLEGNASLRVKRLALALLTADHGATLFRATQLSDVSALAWSAIDAFQITPQREWDITEALPVRVRWALERRGFEVVFADEEFRVEREGQGSWYTLAPWLRRADESAVASAIADRVAKREMQRLSRWEVRCDEAGLETANLAEAFSWTRGEWSRLHLASANERLRLWRDGTELLASYQDPLRTLQAREARDPTRVRMAVEHMLLRRAPWPGYRWELAVSPPDSSDEHRSG